MPGKWYANGYPLSHHAQDVRSRGAAWSMAAKRGENAVVPGRSGSIHRPNKPAAEGAVSLEMWAVGANVDGTMPDDEHRQNKVRSHIEALMRIFGRGALVDLVRTDDDSVRYGRTNQIKNPSLEKTDGTVIVDSNWCENPEVNKSDGPTVIRTNWASNPGMSQRREIVTLQRNYVENPAFMRGGKIVDITTNRITNPSFEASLTGWKGTTNAALTRLKAEIPGRTAGQYVMRQFAPAAGATYTDSPPANVTAGATFAAQSRVRSRVTAGSRTVGLWVRWYRADGTLISTSTIDTESVAPDASTLLAGTANAPTGAVRAVVRLGCASASLGDTFWWDEVMLQQASTVWRYFDGSSASRGPLKYRWIGQPGQSEGRAYRELPNNWISGHGLGQASDERYIGGRSACIQLASAVSSGTILLRQFGRDACKISGVREISAAVWAKMGTAHGETQKALTIRVQCFDSAGDHLGYARTTSGGATDAVQTVLVDGTAWARLNLDGVFTIAGTAACGIVVSAGSGGAAFATDDLVYVGAAVLDTVTAVPLNYWDGDTYDDDVLLHAWEGDPHDSISLRRAYGVDAWKPTTTGVVLYQGRTPDEQGSNASAVAIVGDRNADTRLGMYQAFDGGPLDDGEAPYTFSVNVRVDRAQDVVVRVWRGGTTLVAQQTHTLTANTVTKVSATGTFSPVGGEAITLSVSGSALPQATDVMWADAAMFERTSQVRPYFSGASGADFEWIGDQRNGRSRQVAAEATGWVATGSALPVVYRDDTYAQGTYSACVWASRDGDAGVTNGKHPVTPGGTYTASVGVFTPTAGTVRVGFRFYDRTGAVIATTSSDVSVNASTWTRPSHTVEAPADAVGASPFAVLLAVTAGAKVWFDRFRSAIGSETTYKDGDTSGWVWYDPDGSYGGADWSPSVRLAPRIDNWFARSGTFVSSTDWKTVGARSGLFTTDGGPSPYVTPWREDAADEWTRFPEVRGGDEYTFAMDVKAVTACRVRLEMLPGALIGGAYTWDHGPMLRTEWVDLDAGDVERIALHGIPAGSTSGATHMQARLAVREFGGTDADVPSGVALHVDAASLTADAISAYMDGDTPWCRWNGTAHDATSVVYGPARRALMEVRDVADAETMAGGTRAEVTFEGIIPTTYWEDTYETTETVPLKGGVALFGSLTAASAQIEDAVLEVRGPFKNLTLQDVETGAWVKIATAVPAGTVVVIDNHDWSVKTSAGKSLMRYVTHDGHGRLLPLTPGNARAPRLRITGTGMSADSRVTVRARRKYHVA